MFKSFLVSMCLLLVLGTALVFYAKQKQTNDIQQKPVATAPSEPVKTEKEPVVNSKILIDYKEAVELSKKLDKPMLLFFESNNCVYCKKMKTSVFESEIKQKLLDEYVVCYINTSNSEASEASRSFKIKVVPTYLVVSSKGDVLLRGVGMKSKDDFANWLKPKEVSYID